MLFWILAALLTLAASLAVMRPFLRKREGSGAGVDHDLAVYRDQLAELEREARENLISEADATEARAEIGRRMLRLKEAAASDAGEAASRYSKLAGAIAIAAVLLVPAMSWSLYALLGSPGLPSLPLAARLSQDPAQASIEELIGRAEAHLAANPQDVRGWEVLAPIYARIGRYSDAATAYRRIISLSGSTAELEAALGEAMVGESGGIITAEAEGAFARALALDGKNSRARFFTGMARAQEGKRDEARTIWEEMAAGLPDESPWKAAAGQALASLGVPGTEIPPDEGAGPSQEDIAAAEDMNPEARREMIEGMVANLDARLRENPADADGWRRLLRSYVVLGRQEDAREALARALDALGPESTVAEGLEDFAETLGIGGGER